MLKVLKIITKDFLLLLPNYPINVDGFCPKCGSPLAAKLFMNKVYFVCKNPFCDYYSQKPCNL